MSDLSVGERRLERGWDPDQSCKSCRATCQTHSRHSKGFLIR